MSFRPMLAGKAPASLNDIRYPVLVSAKLDGIRCTVINGVAMSRTLKPIPNLFVQKVLSGLPNGLDGELIVGAAVGSDVMNRTTSGVMSADGEPDFTYHVFDCFDPPGPFWARHERAHMLVRIFDDGRLRTVPHELIHTAGRLDFYEEEMVTAGYEGVMVRSTDGPYKQGRSTEREGYLLKVKRFEDSEAEVIGTIERLHNANEAKTNALGLTERSSSKLNKVATNSLGALVCRLKSGVEFEVGTGFTEAQRVELWRDRAALVGKLAKVKHQGLTPDSVPRFPVWLGWRDPIDA